MGDVFAARWRREDLYAPEPRGFFAGRALDDGEPPRGECALDACRCPEAVAVRLAVAGRFAGLSALLPVPPGRDVMAAWVAAGDDAVV